MISPPQCLSDSCRYDKRVTIDCCPEGHASSVGWDLPGQHAAGCCCTMPWFPGTQQRIEASCRGTTTIDDGQMQDRMQGALLPDLHPLAGRHCDKQAYSGFSRGPQCRLLVRHLMWWQLEAQPELQ